jgi:hypothetical protein
MAVISIAEFKQTIIFYFPESVIDNINFTKKVLFRYTRKVQHHLGIEAECSLYTRLTLLAVINCCRFSKIHIKKTRLMCGIGIQEKILELKTKQKTVIDSIKLYVKSKE